MIYHFRTSCLKYAACVVRDARGASAVEFAVVMPLLLLFILAILCYGMIIGANHSVAQLAADAARATVAGINDTERAKIARDTVAATSGNYPLLIPGKITVEAGSLASAPSEYRVQVTYDASDLPIWAFASLLPLPDKTIRSTAVVKQGGY